MTTANDDWAIVVGIASYPDLGDLGGPENDAREFYRWVTTVGGVPDRTAVQVPPPGNPAVEWQAGVQQARLILSSDYHPPFASPLDANPTLEAVYHQFDWLDELSKRNRDAGNGPRVGRRLYLFFSGHGCEPQFEQTVLLMANATRHRPNYHVPGKLVANSFYKSGLFEEVILLMDCCRGSYGSAVLNIPPFADLTAADFQYSQRFYGFGAKWSQQARERVIDGKPRGVFSAALLAGLYGAASEPDGRITANSLGNWLYANMTAFLDPKDLLNPDTPREPDLYYDRDLGRNLVLATVQPRTYRVRIQVPPDARGKKLELLADRFVPVDSVEAAPAVWEPKPVPPGTYLALISGDGRRTVIEVTGNGDVDAGF